MDAYILFWFFLLRYFIIYLVYHVTIADGVVGNASMVLGVFVTKKVH